jgi:hypothetical protein
MLRGFATNGGVGCCASADSTKENAIAAVTKIGRTIPRHDHDRCWSVPQDCIVSRRRPSGSLLSQAQVRQVARGCIAFSFQQRKWAGQWRQRPRPGYTSLFAGAVGRGIEKSRLSGIAPLFPGPRPPAYLVNRNRHNWHSRACLTPLSNPRSIELSAVPACARPRSLRDTS